MQLQLYIAQYCAKNNPANFFDKTFTEYIEGRTRHAIVKILCEKHLLDNPSMETQNF